MVLAILRETQVGLFVTLSALEWTRKKVRYLGANVSFSSLSFFCFFLWFVFALFSLADNGEPETGKPHYDSRRSHALAGDLVRTYK